MSELRSYWFYLSTLALEKEDANAKRFYDADLVDEVIAQLKAEIESLDTQLAEMEMEK